MNKKLIALVSSVAFLLTPATTVLAKGADTPVSSAENHTGVTDVENQSPENHNTVDPGTPAHSPNNLTGTDSVGKMGKKKVTVYEIDLKNNYDVKRLFKNFPELSKKKIVAAFYVDEYDISGNEAYTVTFTNKTLFVDGHTYKVHHYSYNDKDEKEAPEAVAKDGKITVTLHGASPLLVEDLGVVKKADAKTSANGRKAALNTGVRY